MLPVACPLIDNWRSPIPPVRRWARILNLRLCDFRFWCHGGKIQRLVRPIFFFIQAVIAAQDTVLAPAFPFLRLPRRYRLVASLAACPPGMRVCDMRADFFPRIPRVFIRRVF